MLYIFSKKVPKEEAKYYNSKKNECSCERPKDWEFMKQSGEVLSNKPDTWKAYPDTEAGKVDIIKMEYNEFLNATTPDDMCHELVHLASACLCLWRKLKGIEM